MHQGHNTLVQRIHNHKIVAVCHHHSQKAAIDDLAMRRSIGDVGQASRGMNTCQFGS